MPTRNYSRNRRAVTLMEVLVSIGVLAIGLLGVVSLIPAAGHQAQTGARNERLSNVGRSAFREFAIRNMNSVSTWYVYDGGTNFRTFADYKVNALGLAPTAPMSVCVDPYGYFLAEKGGALASAEVFGSPTSGSGLPQMPRVTIASVMQGLHQATPTLAPPMGIAAEQIFIAQDDLEFEMPKNRNLPPLQKALNDNAGTPLKRFATGRYSWFATMSPSSLASVSEYQMSTVVVGSRNTLVAPEVFQLIDDPNDNFEIPDNVQLNGTSDNVRSGRWILIGQQANPGTPTLGIGVYTWYRIINSADGNLMLEGPKWTGDQPGVANVYAVVMPDVVNVYTKSIRLQD